MSGTFQDNEWYIYALHLKGSKDYRYVGLTTKTLNERLRVHRKNSQRARTPVHKWMFGRNIEISVIEICPSDSPEYLNFREQFWIAALKESGYRLLNLTDGGGGRQGTTHSVETKQKMSQARKGHIPSALTVEKFRQRAKKQNRCPESSIRRKSNCDKKKSQYSS